MGRRPRLHMHRGPKATSEAHEALTCLRRIRGDFIHIIFFFDSAQHATGSFYPRRPAAERNKLVIFVNPPASLNAA